MTSMPRAATFVLWVNAWLRGSASSSEVIDALKDSRPDVSAGQATHDVIVGFDPDRALLLVEALGPIRSLSLHLLVAMPAPGHPIGLAGPSDFNRAALEAGEAVILPEAGIGLIPHIVGGAVEWRRQRAIPPPFTDPREAHQHLRQTLRTVTVDLISLNVASWNAKVPDLLMNPQEPQKIPVDIETRDREAIYSAALCLDIIDAVGDLTFDADATVVLSAADQDRARASLRSLDIASRVALSSVCSAPLR